jgi:uncharacterized repeat protein (TIGR03803 family)
MKITRANKWALLLGLGLGLAVAASPAQALSFEVLHYFSRSVDGSAPHGGVVLDDEGKLYGVANGGLYAAGILYRLSGADFQVLHHFGVDPENGVYPSGPLVWVASESRLWGVTDGGGLERQGTIFSYQAQTDYEVRWSFSDSAGADGTNPSGGLTPDADGTFVGVTKRGGVGIDDGGVLYRFDPSTNTAVTRHDFKPKQGETLEHRPLIIGERIFGAATYGGPDRPRHRNLNLGSFYSMGKKGGQMVARAPVSGERPSGGLVRDRDGALWAPVRYGGRYEGGALIRIDTDADDRQTVGHWFPSGSSGDGSYPQYALLLGADGMLYGSTQVGGDSKCDCGTLFRFDPASNSLTTLYRFKRADGAYVSGPLVRDAAGRLYGTTSSGGPFDAGTIFRLTP